MVMSSFLQGGLLVIVISLLFNLYCIESDEINIPQEYTKIFPINEFLLCRGCGLEVSDSHDLEHISSPQSLAAINRTLFKRESVLVQLLSNPISFKFAVITTSKATCEGFSEWQWGDSWFPGYMWRPCICPECGTQLGWAYEPMNPFVNKPFFGLILSKLIGETFTDSLLEHPAKGDI